MLLEKKVEAACALLTRSDGKVLVIHDFRRGTGLPGGLIDNNETPLECAIRELGEETGLIAAKTDPIPLLDDISDTGMRVQTFVITEWSGAIRSSHEGDVYWTDSFELISAKSAHPFYNTKALKAFRRKYQMRNTDMIRES